MSENRSIDHALPLDLLDGSRSPLGLGPADAAVIGGLLLPSGPGAGIGWESGAGVASVATVVVPPAAQLAPAKTRKGSVLMDASRLRALRESRLLSQQDLADALWDRNIQVSIATIKRAETGHAVRYRILRELARFFEVPFDALT